jgi:hypothetical protein
LFRRDELLTILTMAQMVNAIPSEQVWPFHLSSTTIDQVEGHSRSEAPCTIFVNLVLMIRRKIGFEHSNAFPEAAILAWNIRTEARCHLA